MAVIDPPDTHTTRDEHTLEDLLDRPPRPVDDEVTILVKLSRRNLRQLTGDGVPCSRIALKATGEDAVDPVGVYRIAAEGGQDFHDALPVAR